MADLGGCSCLASFHSTLCACVPGTADSLPTQSAIQLEAAVHPTAYSTSGLGVPFGLHSFNQQAVVPPTQQQAVTKQTSAGDAAERYFDPHIGLAALKKAQGRKRKTIWFVEEGKFEKDAELGRLKAKYGEEIARRIRLGRIKGLKGVDREDIKRYLEIGKKQEEVVPVEEEKPDEEMEEEEEMEEKKEEGEDVPDVEWWDKLLLTHGSYEDVGDEHVELRPNKITFYVEHPVPLEPPAEVPPPPPQPLKLTQKEMRKLRTQRRQQREKEKQELVRQGLLEPPKPKIKISNMMRVLAERAAADPTAIEKEVRKQMEERQLAHEDRNLARKLTPAEKKDKKMKKLFDDNDVDEQVRLLYPTSVCTLAR